MERLILTGQSGISLMLTDLADILIPFPGFRFVWGPLPSPDELAGYLAARSDQHGPGSHWSDYVGWPRATKAPRDLGLAAFCRLFDTLERAPAGFQPPQPDPSLVGRHRIDQRPPVALGSGADRALTVVG